MLIIQFNDGKNPKALAWGYRWNNKSDMKYGIDMIKEIAQADNRFFYLKYASGMGDAIGGFGFDVNGRSNVKLNKGGTCIDPPQMMNPCYAPVLENPGECKPPSINGAVEDNGYFFDYWVICSGSSATARFTSGWFEKYLSYWVTNDIDSRWEYSGEGASSRNLKNGSVDAWYMDNDAFTDQSKSTYYRCMNSGAKCDGKDFFDSITPVMPP